MVAVIIIVVVGGEEEEAAAQAGSSRYCRRGHFGEPTPRICIELTRALSHTALALLPGGMGGGNLALSLATCVIQCTRGEMADMRTRQGQNTTTHNNNSRIIHARASCIVLSPCSREFDAALILTH